MNDDIAARIASFPTWHYEFDLAGHKTPIDVPSRVNGHEQRKKYFFDPLVELCGGSLQGKRVLDLGCNAGFWSLQAVENGCDFVLGIDGRQMHVDQANLVFEVKGVERSRYEFRVGDVMNDDLQPLGPFDIVLCLGLLYHVAEPVALLKKIAEINTDIMVVDTYLSLVPGPYLRVRSDDLADPLHASASELVMSPTKKAVADIAHSLGYSVATLKPRFSDYNGARKYREGRRRAYICAKRTSLARLSAPTEPAGSLPRPSELMWLGADSARRVWKKTRRRVSPSAASTGGSA